MIFITHFLLNVVNIFHGKAIDFFWSLSIQHELNC